MTTAPVTWTPSAQAALDRLLEGRLFATVTEVSTILGLDQQGRTVRKSIAAGEIPAVRTGSTWRVPVAWLLKQAQLGTETETETAGR